jgi:hypothetical protein
LFFAFTNGLPPGVASVTQQTQAFFTVGLAAVFLGDVPTVRQGVGMAIALVGLVLVGLSVDAELSVLGLALAIGGALSWAVGNVLVKRTGDTPMFALVAWLSLVPPIPALVVAAGYDQHPFLIAQLRAASWTSLAAALYLGAIAQPSPTPFGADCLPAIPPPSWHLSRSLRPAWASPVRRWSLVKCSELFAPSACFSSWPGWRWSCCQPAQRRSCWDGNDEDVPRPRMI